MPGLAAKRNDQLLSNASNRNGSVSSSNGFWSKHCDNVSNNQLQKFWSELSPQARQDLLRIDKQTLFEQARKNMYCSRCNGLLLQGYMQIIMYGKSLQDHGAGWQLPCNRLGISNDQINGGSSTAVCHDEPQDPSVHPWGGLTTTKDGMLTLLDCYLYSKSLKGLQNVFDSARARERERELLYPDACGGGGRGWISQGTASYGRGHGTRETCALHTARLSCDTLVDFWSALGEETRQSLLRMKEEDFIERLMSRFDSKRFCRDCRRNVIREFKELKELKRMRREPWCTSWFCVADTAFQYEVSNDTIHADWHQTFIDSIGTYHHFEWGVGSGDGKSDILEFENVGKNRSVRVNGLDLGGLNACYISLRAWKLDGRCTEFSVKAHALKGRQCVHYRLVVGDGYVTITHGEGIRRFFEHAEEIEEEEDDDSMDKDGNDLDGECSRPQKHAKSPELAREFLLDAATVIFKEQVEKAFREGTARQNAHSIFVCLALKLLEDRIHVACKDLITLEKQMKLLEEEEKEKQEEEERKERKRIKEREKKLRRKERLRGKDKDKKCGESSQTSLCPLITEEVSLSCLYEETDNSIRDSVSETGETNISEPVSPDVYDDSSSNDCHGSDGELDTVKGGSDLFRLSSLKTSDRKLKAQSELQPKSSLTRSDTHRSTDNGSVACKSSRYCDEIFENLSKVVNYSSRHSRANGAKLNARNNGMRLSQKLPCSNIRIIHRNDLHSCGCTQQNDYRAKVEPHSANYGYSRDIRSGTKWESASEMHKPVRHNSKFNQTDSVNMRDNCGRPKSKTLNYGINAHGRDFSHTKKVWEPVEPQKRYSRCNSDSDITSRSCSFKTEGTESDKSLKEVCSGQISEELAGDSHVDYTSGKIRVDSSCQNGFNAEHQTLYHFKKAVVKEVDVGAMKHCNLNGISDLSASRNSSSDNCSSCLSDGDNNTPSSHHPNMGSTSTSDSEESSQQSERMETLESAPSVQNGLLEGRDVGKEGKRNIDGEEVTFLTQSSGFLSKDSPNLSQDSPTKNLSLDSDNRKISTGDGAPMQQGTLPSIHIPNISFPVFQGPSTVGYYQQNPIAWPAAPANGYMPYPHPNHYLLTSPFDHHLSEDSHIYMQFGPIHHFASYLMNNSHFPVYQQDPRSSYLNTQGQINSLKANGVCNPSGESRIENVIPTTFPIKASRVGMAEKENLSKPDTGNAGFSLFQCGGPVALPTCRASTQSTNEGKIGDLLCHSLEGGNTCTKKETTIEEYNLFAARNGLQFSIL